MTQRRVRHPCAWCSAPTYFMEAPEPGEPDQSPVPACAPGEGCARTKAPRNSDLLTIGGESLTVKQWLQRSGVSRAVFSARVNHRWTPERAATEPPARREPKAASTPEAP